MGLQNKKLNAINFHNDSNITNLFSNFYLFLKYGGFKGTHSSNKTMASAFLKIYKNLQKDNDNLNDLPSIEYSINPKEFSKEKVYYFNGWELSGKKDVFCNLIKYYKKYGKNKTEYLYKRIKLYSQNSDGVGSSTASRIGVLNNLLKFYFDNNYNKIDEVMVFDFLKFFFMDADKKGLNLLAHKKKWNSSVDFMEYIFEMPKGTILKIPAKDDKGFLTKIKNKNGKQFKTKLITEIPLEVTDNEAIKILFEQINQDVNLVQKWVTHTINRKYTVFKNSKFKLKEDDYGLTYPQIIKNRGLSQDIYLSDLLDDDAKVKEVFLLAVQFQLIIDHPSITESFLNNCELYNNKNELHCIRETDAGTMLVSYKLRKGIEKAEQHILLKESSKDALHKLIEMTSDMRKYLRKTNNNDWRKLFICSKGNSLKPFAPKKLIQAFNLKNKTSQEKLKYFTEFEGFSENEAVEFIKRFTLTRMRASRGVQIFLETESTSKMSQALGHEKYNANLLSHYLPEPILDFFQSRWIRLFQKGIICEAMKDSDYLLIASGFKNMEQLDVFLKNHTLKNLPDKKIEVDSKSKNEDEIYININDEIISTLISIDGAVEKSIKKENIKPEAIYWSKFSKKLIEEINNNKEYVYLREIVEKAKKNININMFNKVIYV